MERVLYPDEMAVTDKATQEKIGVGSLVLMERAALFSYSLLSKNNKTEFDLARVLVVAGCGNNGGDALALARLFYEEGKAVDIYICGNEEHSTESFKAQKKSLMAYGAVFLDRLPCDREYTTIVDGIFGISLNRPVEGKYLEAIEYINSSAAKVLALDMPSGIHAGTGKVMGKAVKADMTASFGFKKVGQLLYPGAEFCGELVCAHIGITEKALPEDISEISIYEESEIVFPERPAYSNKGTFGKVLLIAGSDKISGASLLAGYAAMRSGAGMLKIVTHENNRELLCRELCESMFIFYKESIDTASIRESVKWCDALAIGPGIGTGALARQLADIVISEDAVPVIADADALNILSEDLTLLENRTQPLIVTPHLGEMSRLIKKPVKEIADNLILEAKSFAEKYNCVCVLKDARSIIASPEGKIVINTNGNSGMATAGSGDVLTGIISALLAGGENAFDAAALGAALHGKAGDTGSQMLSEHALMARDIVGFLENI